MSALTAQEESDYGSAHPSEWYDKKHGHDDFCSKMKIYYCGLDYWGSFK